MFTYGMYIAERLEQPEHFSKFDETLYFILVTMTSVGYGDISPISAWGRIVAMAAATMGIILSALLLTTLFNFLSFSRAERHASNLTVKRKFGELALELEETLPEDISNINPLNINNQISNFYQTEHQILNDTNQSHINDGTDKEYTLPSGFFGCFGVPKSVKSYSNMIKKLKKIRKFKDKKKGIITLEDETDQLSVEIKNLTLELQSFHKDMIKVGHSNTTSQRNSLKLITQEEEEQGLKALKRGSAKGSTKGSQKEV